MKSYNRAQAILILIGGTAELVAGHMGHYWADYQTPKKQRQRPRGGSYGRNLMAHFARGFPTYRG